MKLALLSARIDIHTVRWANGLAEREHEIHLLTMHPGGDPLHERVVVHQLAVPPPLGYYLNALQVRRLLRDIQPDVLHAHFASGYGTLGRLSGYHPYVLSVWGRDVYEFPYRSWLHRKIMRNNMQAADHVCSTSHVMAKQTRSLCSGIDGLTITPFGIDGNKFAPDPNQSHSEAITIGTVKKLRSKYGVDVLIRAFAQAREDLQRTDPAEARKMHLLIVGGGPEREKLQSLCTSLGIKEVTTFTGAVPHDQVPVYLNCLDIYVAVSRSDSESFGVAILEASSCEVPVVVSEAGGLPEVVEEGTTGLIVERENTEATAKALLRLVGNPSLRVEMGKVGRQHVLKHYEWRASISKMEQVYRHVAGRETERCPSPILD